MSSKPPAYQYGLPDSPHARSGVADDPSTVALSTFPTGRPAHGLAAAAANTQQPQYAQYIHPFALNPPAQHRMATNPRQSNINGSEAANSTTPSPGKRAFSASYLNSDAVSASQFDVSPSPKRRAGGSLSSNHKMFANSGQAALKPLGTLKEEVVGPRARGATTSATAQNAASATSNPVKPPFPEEYAYYYRMLAKKGGFTIAGLSMEEDDGPQGCVSPHKPVDTPASHHQQQHSPYASVPVKNPQTSSKTPLAVNQDTSPRPAGQRASHFQQSPHPSQLATYNTNEEKARERAGLMRDTHLIQMQILKQRREDETAAKNRGLPGHSSNTSLNPYMQHQPIQDNALQITLQNASTPQSQLQENTPNPARPSAAHHPVFGPLPRERPRTNINKILPAFRQEYEIYEENLFNGVLLQTNLPPWLVLKAKKKAGVLSPDLHGDSDTESEDEWMVQLHRQSKAIDQRIEATGETSPLSIITQPYTGTLSSRPDSEKERYPTKRPSMLIEAPTKRATTTKKMDPATKIKKILTPRKYRTKKSTLVKDEPITPPALAPEAPAYSVAPPPVLLTEAPVSTVAPSPNEPQPEFPPFSNTIEDIIKCFPSVEAFEKWQQDCTDRFFAEQDLPSKRQLKMAEQARRKADKEMKKLEKAMKSNK